MLFLFTHLFTQPVEACTPIIDNAVLSRSFPENGSFGVSMDAVIQLEFKDGITPDDMSSFSLRQDDIVLEIDAQVVLKNTDMMSELAVIEVIPAGLLQPNQQFVLEQAGEPILTFLTSDQLSTEVQGFPQVGWADQYFIDNREYGEMNSCQPDTQTSISIDFGEDSAKQDQAVVIYRVEAQGGEQIIDDEPFAMLLDVEESYVSIDIQNTTADEEFCFAAAYMNEAGVEGELSPVFCANDFYDYEYRCAFAGPWMGCATMNPDNLAWMSLGLGLVGLLRRRRK